MSHWPAREPLHPSHAMVLHVLKAPLGILSSPIPDMGGGWMKLGSFRLPAHLDLGQEKVAEGGERTLLRLASLAAVAPYLHGQETGHIYNLQASEACNRQNADMLSITPQQQPLAALSLQRGSGQIATKVSSAILPAPPGPRLEELARDYVAEEELAPFGTP